VQYDATTFVPGLGASASFWTRRNTIGNLGQVVVLKDVRNANPYTLGSIADQSWQVRAYYASSGRNVYVGHSLGGLVGRHAAFAEPGRAAGILTVASPHRGAPIADNAPAVVNYFAATAVSVAAAFVHGLLGVTAGSVPDAVAHGLLEAVVIWWLRNTFPVSAPAVSDVTTFSPAVAALNRPDDFPHASVYGVIDRRLAWMKTALSAANKDESFPTWEKVYKATVNIFRGCAILGFFAIVRPDRGWQCLKGSLPSPG
jgi:pimeloyl-ACP methyl ester carboxylesterase